MCSCRGASGPESSTTLCLEEVRQVAVAVGRVGVARIFDWEGPMYDVVEIVQFYQPNAQCVRVLSLIIFSRIGMGAGPGTPRTSPWRLLDVKTTTVFGRVHQNAALVANSAIYDLLVEVYGWCTIFQEEEEEVKEVAAPWVNSDV